MTDSEAGFEFVGKLGEEFVERLRRGETPKIRDYVDRFPEHREAIEELFPALAMMEDLAPAGSASLEGPIAGVLPQAAGLDRIGDYRILREIGRGGMGVVYEAEQVSLGRHVALKVLPKELLNTPKHRSRFEREAKAAAKLHHSNIVPVFGVGESDQISYYVMQFIQGLPLDAVVEEIRGLQKRPGSGGESLPAGELKAARRSASAMAVAQSLLTGNYRTTESGSSAEASQEDVTMIGDVGVSPVQEPPEEDPSGKLSDTFSLSNTSSILSGAGQGRSEQSRRTYSYWESVARIGIQVAEALHYAHSQGVFHRDIKPSNLLLDLRGTVWVTDFGLAKLEDDRGLTQTGDILGTLRYMAPETFKGRTDARSEVYSLGLTLYELLALRPAFDQTNRNGLVDQVMNAQIERLGKLRPEIPADLQTVVHKAVERDPEHRYQSAQELAEDLQRFFEDEPIRARRVSLFERMVRWSRHNKGLSSALAAVAALLLVINVAGPFLTWRMARLNADLATSKSELTVTVIELSKTAMDLTKSRNDAQEKAAENLRLAEVADLSRRKSLATLADMQTQQGLLAGAEGDAATAMLWFANAAALTPFDDDRQRENLLRARNWKEQAVLPLAWRTTESLGDLRRFAFQPQGDSLLIVGTTGAFLWDWRNDQGILLGELSQGIIDADWSPDGTRIALARSSGTVEIRSLSDGAVLHRFDSPTPIATLAFSPTGDRLAVGGVDVRIWNLAEPVEIESVWGLPESATSLVFNREGTRLAAASRDKQVRVFPIGVDWAGAVPLFPAVTHDPTLESPPIFADGDRLLITVRSEGKGVTWWDAETGADRSPQDTGEPLSVDIRRLVASPDGNWFAAPTGSSAELWHIDGRHRSLPHPNHVNDVSFDPDSRTLLTVCWDWKCRELSLEGESNPVMTIPQLGVASRCSQSTDGEFIAVASNDNQLRIWKRPRPRFIVGQAEGWDARFRRPRAGFDGRWVTPGTWHESSAGIRTFDALTVVDSQTGRPVGPTIPRQQIVDSCLLADGRSVAFAYRQGEGGSLAIHDVVSGLELFAPVPLPGSPRAVAARPGSRQVAVLCTSGHFLVFDGETGEVQYEESLESHWMNEPFPRITYSPDGQSLIVVTGRSDVHVRDSETWKPRYAPIKPVLDGGPCRAFAVSADGRWLATGVNGRNAVQVWDASTGRAASEPLPHPGDFYGIFSIAFSPDGRWIISGNKDGRARVWDWQAGKLICPPLQHDDEVLDVAFTADGKHALTGVRNGVTRLWELTTGKPTAPPFDYSLPPMSSTETLLVVGERVIAGAIGYPILDLAAVLTPPMESQEDLIVLAELSTGGRIEAGGSGGLSADDWQERWESLQSRRQIPVTLANSIAEKLEGASSATVRGLLADKNARSLAVLKEVVRLRPDVPEVHTALATAALNAGDRALAAEHCDRALETFERQLATDPGEPASARELAELLLELTPTPWQVLTPESVRSRAQAILTPQTDGSVLVSGEHARADRYEITATCPAGTVAAVRLEVLTDPSLPKGGPGRHESGNFQLSAIHLRTSDESGTFGEPLPFADAWASYTYSAPNVNVLGPIRPELNAVWHVWSRTGQPHQAVFRLREPLTEARGRKLVVELDHFDIGTAVNLGRFRLSVVEREDVAGRLQLRSLASESRLSPWAVLGFTAMWSGRNDLAAKLLDLAWDRVADFAEADEMLRQLSALPDVLADLGGRRTGNPWLQAGLARLQSGRGETEQAEATWRIVLSAAEAQFVEAPENAAKADLFAKLLLERHAPNWRTAERVEVASDSGRTFSFEPDGRIVADGREFPGDVYTLSFPGPRDGIAALRLECLPHPSVHGNRVGWGGGNFHLTGLSAGVRRGDGTETPAKFRFAVADFVREEAVIENTVDGPWAVLDDSPASRWDVWPDTTRPHWLALRIDGTLSLTEEDALIVKLEFRDAKWTQAHLGCFRLSFSEDEHAPLSEVLRHGIQQRSFSGAFQVAAAKLAVGMPEDALRIIESAPPSTSARRQRLILLALAARELGDADKARLAADELRQLVESGGASSPLWQLIVEVLSGLGDLSRDEALKLCIAQMGNPDRRNIMQGLENAPLDQQAKELSRIGLWKEAAETYRRITEGNPDDRISWLRAAACFAMAGEFEPYRELCRELVLRYGDTSDPLVADIVCKTGLLLPDAVAVDELPIATLLSGREDPDFAPTFTWFTACAALVAYRSGDHRRALELTDEVPRAVDQARAYVLAVRAMSQHHLGQTEQAALSLLEASRLIPEDLFGQGTVPGPLPTPLHPDSVSHDWLVPEILRREAAAVLQR